MQEQSARPGTQHIALELSTRQSTPAYSLETAGADPLPAAFLAAIIYADLFDYPMSIDELTRFQVGSELSGDQISTIIARDRLWESTVARHLGFYSLAERSESLARVRVVRERKSRRLWGRAAFYAQWISRLPYVRMVAVTGALAVNNVGSLPDIDLMVVAKDGRVWLCRRALIICVRLARLFGDDLCPNYIISESSLDLDQRDFFTAHELAQMVPLYGHDVYRHMIERNDWALRYLPRAFEARPSKARGARRPPRARAWLEKLLDQALFDRLEAWELRRLRARLHPLLGDDAEVVCTPSQCKGHTGRNRQKVMFRFRNRLAELGLLDGAPPVILADFSTLPDER
jgi:hypothetical protein